MSRIKVIILGEDEEKRDYYLTLFSILNFEGILCENPDEIIELIDAQSPQLLFWSFSIKHLRAIDSFITLLSNENIEGRIPKIILATPLRSAYVFPYVERVFEEPFLVSEFREYLNSLFPK